MTASRTSAGGIRLRRKLSMIFQRSSAPSGFFQAHPAAPGHAAAQPGQQLPVAADPAVQAPDILRITRREPFVEHDVRGQRGAAVQPLEQIMADQCVFRHPAHQALAEGGDVIGALAGEDTRSEQVLINDRHRAAEDIDGSVAGIEPAETRRAPDPWRDLDPRLDEGIAGKNKLSGGVEFDPVQRMAQRPQRPVDRTWRNDGFGVQSHHISGVAQGVDIARLHRERIFGAVGEEQVEFLQLAALALPPHPDPFARVPSAATVQHREGPVPWIAPVQLRDAVDQRRQDLRVLRHVFVRAVGRIAQNREEQARIGIGQPMRFQLVEQRGDLIRFAKDHRHHDRRGHIVWKAVLEIELGQQPGRHRLCDKPVG